MQLELFEVLNKDSVCEEGLKCNDCGVVQPFEQFYHMPSGEIKRKCRTCKNGQRNLVKYLKTIHPYPDKDYLCPICNRGMEELGNKKQLRLQTWVLDHCHDTEIFRGWLCSNCNTGLGSFKDDVDKVYKAYKYLKGHLQKT